MGYISWLEYRDSQKIEVWNRKPAATSSGAQGTSAEGTELESAATWEPGTEIEKPVILVLFLKHVKKCKAHPKPRAVLCLC